MQLHVANILLPVLSGEELSGAKIPGGGGELYPTLHCHHQNNFFIKKDSDENPLNVTVRGKISGNPPQTTTFETKESRSGESNPQRPFASLTTWVRIPDSALLQTQVVRFGLMLGVIAL